MAAGDPLEYRGGVKKMCIRDSGDLLGGERGIAAAVAVPRFGAACQRRNGQFAHAHFEWLCFVSRFRGLASAEPSFRENGCLHGCDLYADWAGRARALGRRERFSGHV